MREAGLDKMHPIDTGLLLEFNQHSYEKAEAGEPGKSAAENKKRSKTWTGQANSVTQVSRLLYYLNPKEVQPDAILNRERLAEYMRMLRGQLRFTTLKNYVLAFKSFLNFYELHKNSKLDHRQVTLLRQALAKHQKVTNRLQREKLAEARPATRRRRPSPPKGVPGEAQFV